jgi:superfamily II DNA or RNA helicase
MQDKIQSILNKFPEIQQFTNLQETILKDILLKKDNISRIALFLKAGKGKTILTRAILELLEIKEKDCIVVMTKNLLLSGAWNQFKNRLSKEQFINTESYKFKNKYLIIDEIHFLKEKNTNFYFRYETIKNNIKFLIGLTGTPAPQGDLDFLSLAKMFLDEKYIKSIEPQNTQ